MAKSKVHAKRRKKQDDKRKDLNRWVTRKVKAFNDLPEADRLGLLAQWGRIKDRAETPKEEGPVTASLGGLSIPVEDEGGNPVGEVTSLEEDEKGTVATIEMEKSR